MTGWIRFDTGPLGQGTLFANPVRLIRADRPDQVDDALEQIEAARTKGYWLAGCLSYELGYALHPRLAPLMPADRDLPLIMIGVFDAPQPASPLPTPKGVSLSLPQPLWSQDEHAHAVATIHRHIEAGDTYQVNLTFPMRVGALGDPMAIYAALAARQPVGEGALCLLDGFPILSRSPELFFAVDGNGLIEARPMKGTAPRGATPAEDAAAAATLVSSQKDRAENLMIVDLLRNDISQVCVAGSVAVPHLFQIEAYSTVHQMTSTVIGQLRGDANLSAILRALFPCGSVTGAPKIRAMEIIRGLEDSPRGIYCGAIGWADPAGPMRFNVAIRSPVMSAPGELRLNVGGGIVHDSRAGAEWAEALCKAAFLEQITTD